MKTYIFVVRQEEKKKKRTVNHKLPRKVCFHFASLHFRWGSPPIVWLAGTMVTYRYHLCEADKKQLRWNLLGEVKTNGWLSCVTRLTVRCDHYSVARAVAIVSILLS